MMREILFRGKQIYDGQFITGALMSYNMPSGEKTVIINGFAPLSKMVDCESVDTSTVGQFTGLLDKNVKKIFEGDICRFKEWQHGEFCWVGVIKFEHCQFLITGGPNKECETPFTLCLSRFSSEQIEVIGNIYDNLELLEEGNTDG